ncbi:hypothetical protein Tco_1285813 [Tanacetum coccineum]
MTDTITELIVKEVLEKAMTKSDSCLDYDSINKLSKKIFMELQYNTFGEMEEEDVVDHIADFLGILDPIKILIFDTNRLRLNIFPLSLLPGLQEYGGQVKGTIRSPPGEYLHNDKRIDQMTKSALCHAWVYGWGNNESADDIVSNDEEWEESNYGNPLNTNDDSFLEPYLDAHKKIQNKPNGRMCKAEKFKVIKDRVEPVDNKEGDDEDDEVLYNDYFGSASDTDDEANKLRKRKLKQLRKQAHASEQIY